MDDSPYFTFSLKQTEFRVINGNITQVDADALVSSDDIYLTRSDEVSQDISNAAGASLDNDVRKQQLPLTIGSVVVTGAGKLPAKYIFHAVTLDFSKEPPPVEILLARIIKQILALGNALSLNHIALPLLGAGFAGYPAEQVLTGILQIAAYFVASDNYPTLKRLTVVVLDAIDPQFVPQEVIDKAKTAETIQQRIEKLQALRAEMPDDDELDKVLSARIYDSSEKLRQLFHLDAIDAAPGIRPAGGLSLEGYQKAKERLEKRLTDLNEQITDNQKIIKNRQRRLQKLREEQALKGISTPPEIRIEIEDTEHELARAQDRLDRLKEEQRVYQRELQALHYQ